MKDLEFKKLKAMVHGAVCLDEEGRVIGRLTLEDILEVEEPAYLVLFCSNDRAWNGRHAKDKFGYKYSYAFGFEYDKIVVSEETRKIFDVIIRGVNIGCTKISFNQNTLTLFDLMDES